MAATRLGSLLVLTEDSGKESHATIVEVLKRMLRLVIPEYQTQRLGLEPKDEAAQRAVQGTKWKSEKPEDKIKRIDTLRTVATKLARKDTFVFFHIDGDRTWKNRGTQENEDKFRTCIVERVRELLRRNDPSATPESIEEKLRRLHAIVPYYSIESWLYQNTDVAIRIARERYGGRDVGRFETWQQDRTLLDDEEKPKDNVCLRDAHNLACAGSGYPAEEVAAAGRSYAACYEQLKMNDALVALLKKTAVYEEG